MLRTNVLHCHTVNEVSLSLSIQYQYCLRQYVSAAVSVDSVCVCTVDIWSLVGSIARRDLTVYGDHGVIYPRVVFVIYLDRKPLFYVVNVIIPVMFLVLVVLTVCQHSPPHL